MRCTFWNMHQWPSLAAFWSTILAFSSWPWPMEIFVKDPASIVLLLAKPIFSTSGVGSTPGKSTKNVAVFAFVSLNSSNTLKEGYSTYSTPSHSITYWMRAPVSLSGLIALSSSNLWNSEQSLNALGSSTDSAFSSMYHLRHWRASLSMLLTKLSNTLTYSRPFTAPQDDSIMNLRDSGWWPASRATSFLIKAWASFSKMMFLRIFILKQSIVAIINLWRSNVPRRT